MTNIVRAIYAASTLSEANSLPKFFHVLTPATIDATAIQQCLFCTEAITLVKTMRTPVTAKNKTDSGSGSGFSQMFDSGSKNKRKILLESTPVPRPPLLGSIPHKQSAAQN